MNKANRGPHHLSSVAVAAVLFTCPRLLPGHDLITTNLTYTRDVSRIISLRCSACHESHSAVPLTTYEEVRPWAVAIKDQVLARTMPPWGAVKGFGNLLPDGALNQEEIMTIAAWVVGGAPQGDAALLEAKAFAPQSKARPSQAYADALVIDTKGELRRPVVAAGIRPLADKPIDSAKVVAHLPDGRIVPLVWLSQFNPKWVRTFSFQAPLELPSGTVVQSSSPLRFALEQPRFKRSVPGS